MVKAIVGANWGDEGKGKITDMLAEQSDVVIRFQGGANAGHTIINSYGRFALHTLPSGVFYPHITNIIGNGMALDISKVIAELEDLTSSGVPAPNLIISERAQILMPYHVLQDAYEEERLGGRAFGSTKSGIAPFYSDKYAKIGIQVCDLFDESRLKESRFHIIAVPTPVNTDHTPDLTPVIGASEIVGRNLMPGSIVVYESTVYPGCTEDVCIPILEKQSGLKCGTDFKVGYSPERINPGDRVHRLENIRKIVSGIDEESLEEIKKVYDIVIEVGTHPVSNLRTAEAVKVVENSQRDVNIAFMNELAMVFDRMDIDTNEVVDGMNTKWNALGFRPGLVGGHCIGVDPYYFTHQAEKLGYHSQIILNGRIVNDSMGNYVADAAVKKMIEAGQAPKKSRVAILGLTFKEDCPDTRNSKVDDIIKRLQTYGIKPIVVDPWAEEEDAMREYGVTLTKQEDLKDLDCVIVAVAHAQFKEMGLENVLSKIGK